MSTQTTEVPTGYLSPAAIANRGLDLAAALYPVEPDRAAEIVKEAVEQYADCILQGGGDPYVAVVKLAKEREDDSLVAGYKSVTDLGAGWSTLWLPEDEEDAWYWHLKCAREMVKGIAVS